MDYPHWELDEGRVLLRVDEHITREPSAAEVYGAVFGRQRDICGTTVPSTPEQDIPALKFSRFPAKLALRVFGHVPDTMRAVHGVQLSGRFHQAPWSADQLVLDGRWYPLDTSETEEANKWLSEAGIPETGLLTLGQLIALRAARQLPFVLVDDTESFDNVPLQQSAEVAPIQGLRATLYPYQQTGIRFLAFVADQQVGCILGDEMGLGKTLQIIGLMAHLLDKGRLPCLVVAPATLLENWRRELATFAPGMQTMIHAGPYRTGTPSGLRGVDVVITSYDMAIRDELLLSAIPWELVALDEAQNIKNPEALRTLAVKRLPRKVSIAVTGTPVENCLDDLWSVADFALPGLLGTLNDFRTQFANSIEDATVLAPIVSPILLRRRVSDVAQDLPPRIEVPQPIELDPDLAAEYEDVRQQALAEYGPAGGLVATTRLRLFCAHPSLVDGIAVPDPAVVPKFARLLELLDEIFQSGEKALVFTTYQEMTDLFMRYIPGQWPAHFFDFIDGRVAVPERQPTVDRFFDHHGPGSLFLNPKAAGTGLNITAANHVIHFNPEWNPALTDQATARAYRRRQTRPVTVHSLFYVNTIEEVIMDRASFKRGLAEGAVSGHEGNIDASYIARALQVSPLSGRGGATT